MTRPADRARRARGAVDCGPPERARRGELAARATEATGVLARRVKFECRLDWYQDKGSIDDRQHAAGLRFRREWQLAAADAKIIGIYGLRLPKGSGDFHEARLAARRRVAQAIAALERERAHAAIDICGYDNWAAGRLPILRDALSRLADHYGLPKAEIGGR